MSLRAASQVVCAGFPGTSAGDAPLAELKALGIGAVVLFARNATDAHQVASLTADLHAALDDDVPALVAVDQEGGAVARLHDGVAPLPAMMALGATRDAELTRRAGRRVGRDLRRLGINTNLAPVADLAVDPRNTVIGTRSFGSDAELVSELATAFASGLHDGGTIAVGKHFPGHGATHVDSHEALPTLDVDGDTWRARDLRPFARLAAGGIPAIMTGHVVLAAIDPSEPATRSRAVLDVLRDELHFDGVVFSDCLEMRALGVPPSESAPLAIAAGVDCVLISHHLDAASEAIAGIERAVERGALPLARLQEAARRVRRLRASVPAQEIGDRELADQDDAGIGSEIARRAIAVRRGSLELALGAPVTVVSFEAEERPSLASALRRRGHKSEIMRVKIDPQSGDVDVLEMVLRGLGGRALAIMMRRAHLYPAQAAAIGRLLTVTPGAIVLSAREPYDADLFPQARNLACLYDDTEVTVNVLADLMTRRSAHVC